MSRRTGSEREYQRMIRSSHRIGGCSGGRRDPRRGMCMALLAACMVLPPMASAAPAFELSGQVPYLPSASLAKRGQVQHHSLAKGVLTAPFEGIVVLAGGAIHQDTDANGLLDAGETIAYHYTVINAGDLELSMLALSDGFGAVTCPQTTLLPDQHMICTSTHVVTALEQTDGAVINTAIVTGQGSDGRAVQASDELVTRNLAGSAGVRVFKSPRLLTDVDASESTTLGDIVRYTFVLKNDNADTLTAVTLSEPDPSRIDTPISCEATTLAGAPFSGNGSGSLAASDAVRCSAEYAVRASDVAAGEVQNLAELRATAPGPRTIFATGASLIVVPPAQITLDKQIVSGNPYAEVGDVIQYSYLVRNTGGASLPGPVTVDDDRTAVTCPPLSGIGDGDAVFDVGEEILCSASYTVVQGDLETANVVNVAVASAGSTDSTPDTATAVFIGAPARIGVSKRARSISGQPPYTVIFDMQVSNYGPVTLYDVQVDENLQQTFPAPVIFSVVSVVADGTGVANPGFNGVTDTGLLLPAMSSLAPGASIDIQLQLQVAPQGQSGPFQNQVEATGVTATEVVVTDISTNGLTPDPNLDGVPDEETPTLVSFPVDPLNIPVGSPLGLALLALMMTLFAFVRLPRR